jgi:RHS repeat-associated protein
MKRCRRLLRPALDFVVAFVMVVMSVVGTGSISLPTAHIPPRQSSPTAPAVSSARVQPDLSATALPVGAWYAPHSALRPLYGPFTTGTGATPQKRKPGEQPDLRTETSETILNPDGTWTLKAYPFPIHYKDAQGNWQPIDNTLVSDTSDAGYAVGNHANGWHVHFASQAGGPRLVHAQFPGVQVAETLDGAATVQGTTNGSTITYAGVFPGVDLRYGIGSVSLEETLLVQNAQAPTSYTFTYHIPGASASQDAAGHVIFTDPQGNVLLMIGNVLMYEADAQGQMIPHAALSEKVQLTLAGKGPDFQITYTPDHAWLTDPNRHFPVAIDPTWQGGDSGQNTTSGNIYADTYDESGNPSTDFWSVNSERIGNADVIGLCCNGVSRTYLKFPINPPPGQVRVTSATLKLYQSSQNSGGGVRIDVNAILSSWNATTLDWNNHPTSFAFIGSANTAATQNTWVSFNVSAAAQVWWDGSVALNGFELQYHDESQPQEFFFSDNNTNSEKPTLTINYVQDTTAPGGGLAFNNGATSTNNPAVTVAPTGSDAGSIQEWSSNWTTVNGVGTTADPAANWSVDSTNSQLLADTSPCGSTQCWTQTFFTHTLNINNWPTFTAMFKTDSVNNFQFGVISKDNANTRFTLAGSTSGFTILQYSTVAGQFSTKSINVPISANTWYYGQVVFPLPNAAEAYIWPVGQPRPSTPTVAFAGIYMTNPALNIFYYGDNGANLHHYYIGNVQMTSKDTGSGTTGYGIYGMQLSSDGTTYGCPAYSGSGSISGGPWCVYSTQSFPWTFPTGDGEKTLYYKYVDNAGNVASGSSQIIYDTTPPTVNTITLANGNPAQGSEVRGVVTLAVQATDPPAADGSDSGVASAVLYVDGVQAGTGVTGTSTPTFYLDTTNLAPGAHVLTAKATDAAGNTGPIGGSTTIIVSNTALMPYETLAKRTLPDGQTDVSVNVANGDAVVTHQDLDISGRGPDLALGRTYHALAATQFGYFGAGWASDLDESLTVNADGSVTYRDADGGVHVFLPNGSGGFLTSPGLYLTLVKNGDGSYTLTARDQSKTNFNAAGFVTSLVDRNGNTLTFTWNGSLPTTVTDAAGRQYTLTVTNGQVTQINAPGSRTYNYAYDGNGNLTSYTDPSGVVTQYGYDSSHRLTSITLNYVSGGAQDQQTNVVTTLTYDTNSADLAYNRLIGLTDPMGYVVNISYSIPTGGSALQTQVAQQQGVSPATYETTTYLMTTDGLGAVAKLTDALGNATQYQYDANENVTQVTDPDGHVATSTYDSNGNMLTHVVDPGSSPHLNLTTTYTYDAANNVLTETDPRGIVTQYTYDTPTTGNLIKKVENYVNGGPTNSDTNVTTTYTYDSFGELLTQTDPLGIVTQYTYDSQGDVLTTIANYKNGVLPDSQTNVETSATYDVLGERLTATNPLGIVTQYSYDILGHLLQTVANYRSGVNPDSQTNVKTMEGYDPLGRQVTETNPLGVVTLTTYDKDGRVVSTTANYINGGAHDTQTNVVVSTETYDAAGNTLTATDAKGNVTVTVYDLDNRAVQVTVEDNASPPHLLQNSKTVYDPAGFTSETDTLSLDGNNTMLTKETFTYDAAGRQATRTDPAALSGSCGVLCTSNVTTTTYDADGNATDSKETNAALASPGIVTESTATFDHLNRPLTKTEQANTSSAQTTSYTYDAAGRTLTMTDPATQTTTTAYDALGRVLTVTHPDTTQDTYTYDAAGEQLTQANSAGTTTTTYDALGRVLSQAHNDGSGNFQSSVSYTYDAAGNKLQEVTDYPGPIITTYTWSYDPLNRPVTMSDGARSYTYDSNGNVTQVQVLNASQAPIIAQNMTYDGQNRVSTLNAVANATTTLHNYSYTYDAFGDRTQISDSVPGTTLSYTYDNLMQLQTVKQGSTTLASYTYDANGNRTKLVTSAGTTTYTYDSADVELKSKTDPTGKITNYTYDSNGNLTQAVYDPGSSPHLNQTTTYKYDTSNRLREVDEPSGTTVTFTYDATGNRVQKKVTSGSTTTTIKEVYAEGHLVEQTDSAGNILASFTYDVTGTPTSVVLGDPASGPRFYYAYDAQGNVVALTDRSGSVVASYAYDAFGALTSSSESFPTGWTNPFRYDGAQGVRYDAETGLYWMSVRAYDPTLGRFLSHDPLGRLAAMGLDTQPYVYAGNNPVNDTDPSGMLIWGGPGTGQTAILTRSGPIILSSGGGSGGKFPSASCGIVCRGIHRPRPNPCARAANPDACATGGRNKGNSYLRLSGVSQAFGGSTDEITVIGINGLIDLYDIVLTRLELTIKDLIARGGNPAPFIGSLLLAAAGIFTFSSEPGVVLTAFALYGIGAAASTIPGTQTQFNDAADVDIFFTPLYAQVRALERKLEASPDQNLANNQEFIFREEDTYFYKPTWCGYGGCKGPWLPVLKTARFEIVTGYNLLG